jgi:hypothetical protein
MATSSGPKEAPANNPGLQTEVDPATKGYFLQQTVTRALLLSISPRECVYQAHVRAIQLGFPVLVLDVWIHISSRGALHKQWDNQSVVAVLYILFAPPSRPNPNLLLLLSCGMQRKNVSDE